MNCDSYGNSLMSRDFLRYADFCCADRIGAAYPEQQGKERRSKCELAG